MIRMPRGLVYVLVSTTFRLSFFAISFAFAGDVSSGPDGRRHHRRTVTDASGAVIPGATVTIENPVSGLSRTAKTDASGQYRFTNLPFNPYHLTAHAEGFSPFTVDVPVRSSVAVTPIIKLQVGGASTTVTVTGDDLVENDTSLHTDIDRSMIEKLPLESSSSSVSSLATPPPPE